MTLRQRLMGFTALRAPDGAGGGGGDGGAAAGAVDFAALHASVPEAIRGHEALNGVKDIGGLVKGLSTLATPKPSPAAGSPEARQAFLNTLPENLRGEATFKDIHDVEALAKSYHGAAKMVGMDKARLVALPAGPDDKEGAAAFRKAIGVPESVDKYVIPKRADGKDYSASDQAFQKSILPILHEADVPQSSIDRIVPKWNAMLDKLQTDGATATKADLAKQAEAFKAELGGGYESGLKLAGDTLAHYAKEVGVGAEVIQDLDRDGLGSRPGLTKILMHLGKQLQEDGLLGKDTGGGGGGLVPNEAQQQIKALEADAAFMKQYRNKTEPGHAEAVAKMQKLYESAYPAAAEG